jgi:hypothetical protein
MRKRALLGIRLALGATRLRPAVVRHLMAGIRRLGRTVSGSGRNKRLLKISAWLVWDQASGRSRCASAHPEKLGNSVGVHEVRCEQCSLAMLLQDDVGVDKVKFETEGVCADDGPTFTTGTVAPAFEEATIS